MKRKFLFRTLIVAGIVLLISAVIPSIRGEYLPVPEVTDKINGVNFVAPSRKVGDQCMKPLDRINSEWVALNPYAYGKENDPRVYFDLQWQWWGESTSGTRNLINYAKKQGLKVMVKPHIWVRGQGWMGDFDLKTEAEWKTWESDYEKYVLAHAKLAEEMKADMFCIGVEMRQVVKKRPNFFSGLISKVRAAYKGPITYASNWDNFQEVTFWEQLDYIGIDSYFPLSQEVLPTTEDLKAAWSPHRETLRKLSGKHNKPILFTEFGYRSIDRTAWRQWELPEHWEPSKGGVNLQAQQNAYRAIFESFWAEPWFAGGFLWKWYPKDEQAGGENDRDYTPQNKPVEVMIRDWYSR